MTKTTEHVVIKQGKHHFEVVDRWGNQNMGRTHICWTLNSAYKVAAKEYPDLPIKLLEYKEETA